MFNEAKLLPFLYASRKPTEAERLQRNLNYLSNNYYRIMDVVRESGMGVQEYKDYLLNEGVDISKFESFFDQFEWDGTGLPIYKNRNILLNSDDFTSLSTGGTVTYTYQDLGNGYTNIKTEGGTGVLKVYRQMSNRLTDYRGQTITYSIGIKNNTANAITLLNNGIGGSETVEGNEIIMVNHTASISETATPQIQFRSESSEINLDFDITPIMVILGDNPANEWKLAPEDSPTKGLYYNENNNEITPILPANYDNIINFRSAKEQVLNDNGFFEIDITEADVLDNDLQPSDLTKQGNKYVLN